MKPWQKKEKKDAKDFSATRQRGSGNSWQSPSDSVSKTFSIDSKFTSKNSYSFSIQTWNKLCEEAAWNQEKIPLLSIAIQNIELVVLSKDDFLRLIKKEN